MRVGWLKRERALSNLLYNSNETKHFLFAVIPFHNRNTVKSLLVPKLLHDSMVSHGVARLVSNHQSGQQSIHKRLVGEVVENRLVGRKRNDEQTIVIDLFYNPRISQGIVKRKTNVKWD